MFVVPVLLMASACQKQKYDIVIRGAQVYDGSGGEPVVVDVGVRADTIAAIGNLSEAVGAEEVNANGLVLAPGFIDTHSHHDRGLLESPAGLAVVSQGITTIIVGQDGGSHLPLRQYFQLLTEIKHAPTRLWKFLSPVGQICERRKSDHFGRGHPQADVIAGFEFENQKTRGVGRWLFCRFGDF